MEKKKIWLDLMLFVYFTVMSSMGGKQDVTTLEKNAENLTVSHIINYLFWKIQMHLLWNVSKPIPE